jgi:mannose-6-phosphate isomerase-like protein (cupin superfamily)
MRSAIAQQRNLPMQKLLLAATIVLCGLSAAGSKPTTATYISAADLEATLQRAPQDQVADQQVRVADAGKVNVGVGVVYRSAAATQVAAEHDQMTEVYHIIDGSGTLVTGGTVVNPRQRSANETTVRDLNGPGVSGTKLENGESRHVGPGDVVIIPAGVGHWFSSVDGRIRYLVIRVDADKLLQPK